MAKTIYAADGRQLKCGRIHPVALGPRLSLKNYLIGYKPARPRPHDAVSLPTPPKDWDYTIVAAPALGQMYGNDSLGNCVIAGMAHLEGVFTAIKYGTPSIFTLDQIVMMYSAIGGYVPGNPNTDNGCDEQTALAYWQKNGFLGHSIAGSLAVDATNVNECVMASWLFSNLMLGMDLPDAWVNPAPSASSFIWDVAGPPNPDNGHCVVSAKGAVTTGLVIETWGLCGILTWEAVRKYCQTSVDGELYTVLTPEIIELATNKSPNGFDWASLQDDFAAIGQAYT